MERDKYDELTERINQLTSEVASMREQLYTRRLFVSEIVIYRGDDIAAVLSSNDQGGELMLRHYDGDAIAALGFDHEHGALTFARRNGKDWSIHTMGG